MITIELENNQDITRKECEELDRVFNLIGIIPTNNKIQNIYFCGINSGKFFRVFKQINTLSQDKIKYGEKTDIDFIRIESVSKYDNNKEVHNSEVIKIIYKNIELKKKLNILLK